MKKRLLIIVSFVCFILNSCVVEEYEQPRGTEIGCRIASNSMTSILSRASLTDIARVADKWNKATMQEKYQIEDDFFGNTKLRVIGDTIDVVGNCKINTFGKSLLNNSWEVIVYDDMKYIITNRSLNVFTVEGDINYDPVNLTVEFQEGGSVVYVSGSGNVLQLMNLGNWYTNLEYIILNPIKMDLGSVEHSVFWLYCNYVQVSGAVDVKPFKATTPVNQDNTKISFENGNATLFFRNRSESYTNIYWGNYYW